LAANRRANVSFVPMALEEQAAKDVLGNPGVGCTMKRQSYG
jgi:hypothetical protein